MGRLFAALFNKNTVKAVTEATGPKLPNFQKEASDKGPKNPFKLVGLFWSIGIPATLVEFYFLQKQVESEKRFYYKLIRDDLRQQQQTT